MSLWIFAVLWTSGASAAIVDAPVASRVTGVPTASVMAPPLAVSAAALNAFPAVAPLYLAPPPPLSQSAIPEAGIRQLPPLEPAAVGRGTASAYVGAAAVQAEIPTTPQDWANLDADDAAAFGRRLFDRSALNALSPADVFTDHQLDLRFRPFAGGHGAPTETVSVQQPLPTQWRNAVAASASASVSMRAMPQIRERAPVRIEPPVATPPVLGESGPRSFERLSIEFGDGLRVNVNAVLTAASPMTQRLSPTAPPLDLPRLRVPVTSTQWLERAGLFEQISYADYASRAVPVASRVRRLVPPMGRQAPAAALFAWWLAVIPAAFLFRQLI